MPLGNGPRHDEETRFAACAVLWRQVPAELRIPLLLETLARYRNPPADVQEVSSEDPVAVIRSGKGLNDLIISGYRLASGREAKRLRMFPDEEQALAILRTAYHYCGHGEDTAPPLRLALRHFQHKAYSDNFFDALRVYRECLAHTRPTATQRLRSEIDLILWQDLRARTGGSCWSERIRRGLRELGGTELALWKGLFQSFCYATVAAPPRRWKVQRAVERIGRDACVQRLLSWMAGGAGKGEPTDRPVLTSPGSYVLKNLVWMAAVLDDHELQMAMHRTLLLPWKDRRPLEKVAVAVGWMWSRGNDREKALSMLTEILRRFGSGGEQLERMWRECGGSEWPEGVPPSAERRQQALRRILEILQLP